MILEVRCSLACGRASDKNWKFAHLLERWVDQMLDWVVREQSGGHDSEDDLALRKGDHELIGDFLTRGAASTVGKV